MNAYAPPMRVIDTVLNRSRFGDYHLSASLQNQGPDPVYEVGVRAVFFSEQGQWIETYTTTAVLPANFPGHFNPIEIITWIDTGDYPNASFDLQIISWTLTSGVSYWPLTVIDSHAIATGSEAVVEAVFRNQSPYPLAGVRTLTWELHQSTSFSYASVPGVIGIGETFTQTWVLWGVYESQLPGFKIEGQGVAAP